MAVDVANIDSELQTALKTIQGVAASHQVARLEAFGSAVTGRLHGDGDVDLLVSFKPMEVREHGRHFFGLKADLEAALGRPVDLLELDALTNPYFLKAIEFERTCSMPRDVRVYLYDILKAGEALTTFCRGKTFDDYASDPLLRSAVERQLGIVGEALSQALKLEPAFSAKITSARQIIGFRNLLVHAYAAVSAPVVWTVLEVHLPVLIAEVETLLAEFADD